MYVLVLAQNAPAQQDECALLYVAACWCGCLKNCSRIRICQQQPQEQPPEKNHNSKIHVLVDRYVDCGEEIIDWLIATTAGQTVPERDQALRHKLHGL